MKEHLHIYSQKLTNLKRGGTKYGLAPHKPVLLLSIIDGITHRNVLENSISIDKNLFDRFKANWKLLVSSPHNCDITLPLFHFQKDGFWQVVKKDGEFLDKKISSESQILKQVSYGRFDDTFFQLIRNPDYLPLVKMLSLIHISEPTRPY